MVGEVAKLLTRFLVILWFTVIMTGCNIKNLHFTKKEKKNE